MKYFALLTSLARQSLASSATYLLLLALTLAISATTALKFSHSQIRDAIHVQAAAMQAADLVLTDQKPIEAKWGKLAEQLHLQQSKVTVFNAMAHRQDQFVMVNVKAIENNFPLRGVLELQPVQKKIASGEVWLSPRAAELLKVKVGDEVALVDAKFTVAAIIQRDSNQELGFSAFSPTVLISQQDLAKTQAVQQGSRIESRLLLAGNTEQIDQFSQQFKKLRPKMLAELDEGADPSTASELRLRTADKANIRLVKPIDQLNSYLQLANILTLLLCGIAIALSCQRYMQQNQDDIALLRCMGASRLQVITTYLCLLLLIVMVAIVLGSGLGMLFAYSLLQLLQQLIPQIQFSLTWTAIWTGPIPIAILTSVSLLVGFVLPSLWQLVNTAPVKVLRPSGVALKRLLWTGLSGGLSLVLFTLLISQQRQLGVIVLLSAVVLCAVVFLLMWGLLTTIKATKLGLARYIGLPVQSAIQITALSLGLGLIAVLLVLRQDMSSGWQQQLPAKTPNQFVYGLPPFELSRFEQQLSQNQWQATALYPNIRARLVQKNGQSFSAELISKNNALRRELNLTQSKTYPRDNVIVQGDAVLKRPGDVSVEVKLANTLGIKVGDQLSFSLPEGQFNARVVNLRQVEWQSFSPNFFFIFAEQSLDENAGSYLGSFYVPPSDQHKIARLIEQFPSAVIIDMSLILNEVKQLIQVLLQVLSVLAILVAIAGILVLLACINLLLDQRKKEVALLRSFGGSRAQLKRMLTIEFALLGAISGFVACICAEVIAALLANQMNMAMQMHLFIWVFLPLGMACISGLIGRYRLGYLCDLAPLKSLREFD